MSLRAATILQGLTLRWAPHWRIAKDNDFPDEPNSLIPRRHECDLDRSLTGDADLTRLRDATGIK
jgi:hypothetical protein